VLARDPLSGLRFALLGIRGNLVNFGTFMRGAIGLALTVALAATCAAQGRRGAKRPSADANRAKRTGGWPAFETRHTEWIRRKQVAAEAGHSGPEPLVQYLVDEIIVTGVFESEKGFGAFLYARPTGTTFFVEAGEVLFNGRLTAVTPGESGFVEDTEIVFVERSSGNGPERRVVKHVEPAPSTEPKAPEGAA